MRVFDASAVYQSQWGSSGTGNSQFATPVALAVSPISGDVYVVDQGNDRIQQFDEDGVFIRAFGSPGTGNGQFGLATAIAIHPDERGRLRHGLDARRCAGVHG